MRTLALLAAASLMATAAQAAPASVNVTLSPELEAKAQADYGVRDVSRLAEQLRTKVERAAAQSAAYDGARIELTLSNVVPNRPTFQQMGAKMGLSAESFGVGGATIEGHAIRPDGSMIPLSYKWYETDITMAPSASTWHDAESTINRFAWRLAREQLASR